MDRNPYFYFKELYKNSNELIVCTDENLKIIYLTNAFMFKYNFDTDAEVTLNCIIPTRFFGFIANAIKEGRCVSADYICIHSNEPKKCVVIPIELNGERYATILIIESTKLSFDSKQNSQLKYEILKLDAAVREYASAIMSDISMQTKDSEANIFNNRIFLNSMRIRRETENLAVLARTDLRVQKSYIINLNDYVKRTIKIMTELLGQNRIEFLLSLHNSILIAEISYDVLDILTSNIVYLCIKNTKGKARVFVNTIKSIDQNIVVFADSPENCSKAVTYLADPDNTDNKDLTTICKIIKENSGRLAAVPNEKGGYSIAFSLPKVINRPDIIREDTQHTALKDITLSKLAIGLSAVMDTDTDFSKFNSKGK